MDELETQVDDLRQMVMTDGKQTGRFRRPKAAEPNTSTPRAEDVRMGTCPDAEAAEAVKRAMALAKLGTVLARTKDKPGKPTSREPRDRQDPGKRHQQGSRGSCSSGKRSGERKTREGPRQNKKGPERERGQKQVNLSRKKKEPHLGSRKGSREVSGCRGRKEIKWGRYTLKEEHAQDEAAEDVSEAQKQGRRVSEEN